jgi:hypothetical protein
LTCTRDLKASPANVKAPVYAYVDVAQVWLKRPLTRKEMLWVNGQIGHPLLGRPFVIQRGRRQRLRLTRPTEVCLRFFAERDDQLNHVEIALDIITPFARELKRATRFGFVQPRHGSRKSTIFDDNGNFRTADLGHPGVSFQAYDDKPSKVTGEFPCFHFEAKITRVAALRRLGIHSVADLLTFDHAKFWHRHFVVHEIGGLAKLGRCEANRVNGTRRRTLDDNDVAVGIALFLKHGAVGSEYTVQQFLKTYAKAVGSHTYVIAATTAHSATPSTTPSLTPSATPSILYRFGIIPEPDLSLLTPEVSYPLGARPKASMYSIKEEGRRW